jgi:hypothetical protein
MKKVLFAILIGIILLAALGSFSGVFSVSSDPENGDISQDEEVNAGSLDFLDSDMQLVAVRYLRRFAGNDTKEQEFLDIITQMVLDNTNIDARIITEIF